MKYDFDKHIDRRNTHSMKWDIYGGEYLPLWVADSDFPVPPAVINRIQKRVEHPFFGYFLNDTEIKNVIKDWFIRRFNVGSVENEWIVPVPGIVPALMCASNIGGGRSMACTPNYCCLLTAPGKAGNEMIRVPLIKKTVFSGQKEAEEGTSCEKYFMDFEKLQECVTEDTKIFYLCNPHNPVGRVYSRKELLEVSEFAERNGLIVVSDEAHCELVFEGAHIPFFTVSEYARNNSITLYSNGKTYNVPDLIFSFEVIPNEDLRKEFNRVAYALGDIHSLNVETGIASFGESDEWREQLLEYLRGNRDFLEKEIKERFPKAKFPHVEATYLMWVDLSAYGTDINASFFRKKAGIMFTDGTDFGDPARIRINFATQRAVLEEALEKMNRALKDRLD